MAAGSDDGETAIKIMQIMLSSKIVVADSKWWVATGNNLTPLVMSKEADWYLERTNWKSHRGGHGWQSCQTH